ncbi:MAG TPA: ABC-F family ATP-binding cassette domain-containing protein [Levilinea sp.]|nr:ABC-F family ATP-binding cassette domain-containing protein [Levilinea sp.]
MLSVNQISKSYGIDPILHQITFTLNSGERIGLIGPNGCGKSTLLRLITGAETAGEGSILLTPASLRIGYLPQGFSFCGSETPSDYLNQLDKEQPELSIRLEVLAARLAEDPDQPDLQIEFDRILNRMETCAENAGRAPAVLAALGLGDIPPDLPVKALSGGQKTRLALAGVLLSNPQLLLLDEPTNHLDIAMLEWLEDWLVDYPAAALIVSHDRVFLDRVATGIIEIDALTHESKFYPGNYTAYLEARAAERQRQWQEYTGQQVEITRLKAAAARMRSNAKYRPGAKGAGDTWAPGFFANRTKETVAKAKNIEKRVKRLLNEDHIEKPRDSWQIRIDFGDTPTSGRDVLVLENLSAGYAQNVLLHDINLTLRYGERVALIGANGSGKTTLFRIITGELEPLAGRVRLGSNVVHGYMAQEQENLALGWNAYQIISQQSHLNETETRRFLAKYLFTGDDVFVPMGQLSYGERTRLALACLAASGCNFLLLDEPINHLDIPSRARFEQALKLFEGTVLAIVHDRYFIRAFASQIWELRDRRIWKREHL